MGKKLSWGTKFGYGFGTFGKSMSYGLANGFISMYFVSVLGLSTEFLAVMFFLARIWDGVNDLLMGTIIDNTKSRLGKFRPWVLSGALLNAVVTVGLFWQPGLKGAALYVFATAMYLLWDASYTMIDVSYWSMIPALTLDSKERDQVSMLPRIIGGAAGIIGAFTMQIVDKLGGPVINGGYLKYAMISSAVYIVTAALCVMTTKENVSMPSQEKDKFSLGAAARILFSNDQTLVIVGIMILFNLANNLTNAVSPFYFCGRQSKHVQHVHDFTRRGAGNRAVRISVLFQVVRAQPRLYRVISVAVFRVFADDFSQPDFRQQFPVLRRRGVRDEHRVRLDGRYAKRHARGRGGLRRMENRTAQRRHYFLDADLFKQNCGGVKLYDDDGRLFDCALRR